MRILVSTRHRQMSVTPTSYAVASADLHSHDTGHARPLDRSEMLYNPRFPAKYSGEVHTVLARYEFLPRGFARSRAVHDRAAFPSLYREPNRKNLRLNLNAGLASGSRGGCLAVLPNWSGPAEFGGILIVGHPSTLPWCGPKRCSQWGGTANTQTVRSKWLEAE
jgi:hypothetical protein